MTTHRDASRRARRVHTITLAALLSCAGAAHAVDNALAAPLCNVLQKLIPKVRGFQPVGARAQLVMAVAEAFDYDAKRLQQVQDEIDPVTSAACPKERDGMLAILKMKTLADAVR